MGRPGKIDKQNPQRFAANFKTPTLVLHGEKDFRVPVTQGLEYYNTLRIKGVPTRLIYFPDENHWILQPQNSACGIGSFSPGWRDMWAVGQAEFSPSSAREGFEGPYILSKGNTTAVADAQSSQSLSKAAIQNRQHLVNSFISRNQRRAQSDPVRVKPAQQAILQRPLVRPARRKP